MNTDHRRTRIGNRVTIYTRGRKKTYVADFWQDNVHRRISLKTPNMKIAIERATRLAAELDQGSYHRPPADVTTQQAVDDYLAHLRTENRARKTLTKYTGVLNAFVVFLTQLRITRLAKVGARHFDQYRALRAATRHRKTVYVESVVLKQLFRWAKSRRYLTDNPLADIKLGKPVAEPKGGPSLDQVNQLLGAADERLRSQLAVLAYTGMRSGELQRLRPEDVDLGAGWIHIVSRAGAETKTRTSRKVPIHDRLRPILSAVSNKKRDWLFQSAPSDKYPTGGRPMNTKRLNDCFTRLLKSLGLPAGRKDGFVIHSLRHFFETFTVNAGIPQRVIDTWLGHRSDKSMAAVYYRLADAESQAFMKKVPFGTGLAGADDTRREVEK
ncbi:MAG TPA: site-specific integrase [Gemmataceae bacterium]|nr:site-specific integrase [Gemmataceae bacterium]